MSLQTALATETNNNNNNNNNNNLLVFCINSQMVNYRYSTGERQKS
jgi:hypothetical protein